jgi:hypothetical protein
MEATLVSAGIWTSITAGVLLLIPVIIEFCKRNIPICFGIALTLTTIYTMTPYSVEADNAWNSITHYPEKVWQGITSLTGH